MGLQGKKWKELKMVIVKTTQVNGWPCLIERESNVKDGTPGTPTDNNEKRRVPRRKYYRTQGRIRRGESQGQGQGTFQDVQM